MKKRRVILIFVIVVLIVIVNYINYKRSKNDPNIVHPPKEGTKAIPEFNVKDTSGRNFSNAALKGKNVYFQFINQVGIDDIDLYNQVYKNFKNENLGLVIITDDIKGLQKKINIKDERVHIVGEQFEHLQKVFSAPKSSGSFFLYDASGKRVATGNSNRGYENGPKLPLYELIWKEYFDISEFVNSEVSIHNMEWFGQISQIIEKEDKKVFLFYLSVNLCDQCGGGAIVNRLKHLKSKYGDSIGIFTISYTQYSDNEIEVLKSQSQIAFPVINADSELLETWSSLIQRFNTKSLDNIVFITDKTGKVYSMLYSKCKCFEIFFDTAETIIKERLK